MWSVHSCVFAHLSSTIRYDVRNLLDDLSDVKFTNKSLSTDSEDEEELLDVERYADLDSDEEELFFMSDEDERDQYVGK
jgi:hypothetical protein